jgi:ABC-2 type transport system permease protein
MRVEKVGLIARREYLSRIKTKGFWIGTVALPLFMAAMMVVPSLMMMKARSTQRLVVVDATGQVAPRLDELLVAADPEMRQAAGFEITHEEPGEDPAALRRELDRRIVAEEIDAWVWIDQQSLDDSRALYHAESVSNFLTQERLEDALSEAVEEVRVRRAGYDVAEIGRLTAGIDLQTVKVSEEGTREEGGLAGVALAYFLFFLLYMILILYGTQVMNGVLEEKSSRVVEVVISTVTPFELLLGKLLGIGATGLTQLAIWLGTMSGGLFYAAAGALAWIPEDVSIPTMEPALLVHFLILFLLGFFLFATLYAAIGSAFNNVQEAQQFASVAVFLLIAPIFFFFPVVNDPDSTLAVVTSLVPFFTPLLMMLRIAIKTPPLWQILLGYLLTGAFTIAMVWICAKIYRVGILMYGKKPTLAEIWRWVRYA